MIRGFMKTTSLTTLVAAAGILMGNFAYAPANAADLGGGCCADLEERVAELEATTARKGNRVVSLQIYGQVNKGLLIWDDGVESDAYVVDNDASGSRIGFKGEATLRPGWKAGYLIELNIQDAATDVVSQNNDEGDSNDISIRFSNWYIENERLGRLTVGQASRATDGINEIILAGSLRDSSTQWGGAFVVRTVGGGSSSFTLDDFASDLDGGRDDVIRYDSPSLYGFIFSASWGDDDIGDIALRYQNEWNSVRIAAGIGYQWVSNGSDYEVLSGSISVMHIPTGIYAAFSVGGRDWESSTLPDDSYWYVQAGVERKWLPYGSTTIYGDVGHYDDFLSSGSSEADRWGLGLVQRFDSAAMEFYAQASFWDFDDSTATEYEGQSFVLIGSRIKF